MGIDYNNYMVFGWAIQYDNIVDYALDHELQCDCSDKQHTTVSMCKPHNFEISVEYEHFTFEIMRTCPWYDCDLDECLWYFGVHLGDSKSVTTLKELISIPEASWFPILMQMVEELGEDGEPEIYSVLHVN